MANGGDLSSYGQCAPKDDLVKVSEHLCRLVEQLDKTAREYKVSADTGNRTLMEAIAVVKAATKVNAKLIKVANYNSKQLHALIKAVRQNSKNMELLYGVGKPVTKINLRSLPARDPMISSGRA